MKINGSNKITGPRGDDAQADWLTFLWMCGFLFAIVVVDILSAVTEHARDVSSYSPLHFAVWEITSVLVLLALFPLAALATSRGTPGQHQWPYVISLHLAVSIVFSLIHIALMVGLRKLIFLMFASEPYIFTDNVARDLIYEYRKDVITYALFVFLITFGRQLAHQRREISVAREEAKRSKRLTLKCGGRSIFIAADTVCWVKSASNYAEVAANGKIHLARTTLAALENQLIDAGVNAIRVHRSYIVNADHIHEIRPTGEGDVKIEMADGQLIPGSRRYRERLPAYTS